MHSGYLWKFPELYRREKDAFRAMSTLYSFGERSDDHLTPKQVAVVDNESILSIWLSIYAYKYRYTHI